MDHNTDNIIVNTIKNFETLTLSQNKMKKERSNYFI